MLTLILNKMSLKFDYEVEQTVAGKMIELLSCGLSEGPPPIHLFTASIGTAHIWLLQLSFDYIEFSVNPHIYI